MRIIQSFLERTAFGSLPFFLIAMLGCNEKPIVYSERIALLPDQSGFLTKDIRSLDKSKTELAINEVVGPKSKELFVLPLIQFYDVKFKTKLKGDTILLFSSESTLVQLVKATGPSKFPIQFHLATGSDWLSAGIPEGDPLYYSEEKWKTLTQMMQSKPF